MPPVGEHHELETGVVGRGNFDTFDDLHARKCEDKQFHFKSHFQVVVLRRQSPRVSNSSFFDGLQFSACLGGPGHHNWSHGHQPEMTCRFKFSILIATWCGAERLARDPHRAAPEVEEQCRAGEWIASHL